MGSMSDSDLKLRVILAESPATDPEALYTEVLRVRTDLLQLDVESVQTAASGRPPAGARAIEINELAALILVLAPVSGLVRAVLGVLQTWCAMRSARSVKIEIDEDTLEVTAASERDIDKLVELIVERHRAT
jgi:hypothetical protein